MEVAIKGKLEQRHSDKTGKDYVVLVITFANGYTKVVFLDEAEKYMLASGK